MILRDHLLLGMPFQTTSLLPLTVSVSSVPNSLSPPPPSEPLLPRPDHQHKDDSDRLPSAPASAGSDAPASTSPASKSNPPPPPSSRGPINHARRYTLSRFPLLRKGSRELSRTPSTTKSPAESPFYATGAPRSSQSLARGPDLSPAREFAASPHEDGDVIAEEEEATRHLSERLRAGKPDKMHQTSSRLLRMTDDERPYTRVSTTIPHFPTYPRQKRRARPTSTMRRRRLTLESGFQGSLLNPHGLTSPYSTSRSLQDD